MMRKLILLEPSKVGNQHITLIIPYLEALVVSAEAGRQDGDAEIRVEAWLSKATFAYIPEDLKQKIAHKIIPVIDPNKRQFVRKVILEWLLTLWVIAKKRPNDLLLVTCLMSPSLYLLEKAARYIRFKNVHVVLHGELEALLDSTLRPSIRTYGYWCRKWWKVHRKNSGIGLVVIDYFIREKLLVLARGALQQEAIQVVCLPIQTSNLVRQRRVQSKPRVCFLGYRSEFKGFEQFTALAQRRLDFEWLAIGGGMVENIRTGECQKLLMNQDYQDAITSCEIALFPYLKAYDISLSAALIDAVSVGLYSIASHRGCFDALSKSFGQQVIRCYSNPKEIDGILDSYLESPATYLEGDRAAMIEQSHYSLRAVKRQMQLLVDTEMS